MANTNTNQNTDKRKAVLISILKVFEPSTLGFIVYLMIFGVTLAIAQPSAYKTNLQQFHISQLKGTFIFRVYNDYQHIINTQLANDIALYVFWATVASIIYLIASRITKNFSELTQDISFRRYIWPKGADRNRPLKEFMEKLIFRVMVAIAFLLYLFKTVPLLVHTWKNDNLALGLNLNSIKEVLILFIIELLLLHIAVILIRLFLIRKRVIETT